MARADQQYTLTLTRNHQKYPGYPFDETNLDDEGYGSSSPPYSAMSMIPMTIPERPGSPSPTTHSDGSKKFRFPWGHGSASNVPDQVIRLEREKEADEYIQSLSGRSLSIQLAMLQRTLTKEKRRVKFGLSSSKIMDLALRRYSYKVSELQRDIQLERSFPKCPEEFGFVLRHYAERLKLTPESQKFRKMYWELHGRYLDMTRVMFDDTSDMARKRQLALERIPCKVLHPENSEAWWGEDVDGNIIPSREHVEWICWGYTPDIEEVSRICRRIARLQPPDSETVRLYRAQAVLSA